jgi:hypothetical protein
MLLRDAGNVTAFEISKWSHTHAGCSGRRDFESKVDPLVVPHICHERCDRYGAASLVARIEK